MGVASSRPVVSTAAVAAAVMATIPVVTVEAGSEVTLAVPPPMVTEEERRESGLPILPGGGAHGSPAWSELEGSGGTTARLEVVHLPVSHGVLAVDIPFFGEEENRVEPPTCPLSWELVMIRSLHDTSMARSSSRSGATHELVWACFDEPGKAQFILHDKEEVKL